MKHNCFFNALDLLKNTNFTNNIEHLRGLKSERMRLRKGNNEHDGMP